MDRTELALTLILLAVILAGLGYREYWGGLPDVEPVVIHPQPAPTPVSFAAPGAAQAEIPASTATVFLNTATARQLTNSLGLAPYQAEAVVRLRDTLGGRFQDPRQLLEVPGIDTRRYQTFANRLQLEPPEGAGAALPVNLNHATLAEIEILPGFGPVLAERILEARSARGTFRSWDDVSVVPGVGAKRLDVLQARFVISATAE